MMMLVRPLLNIYVLKTGKPALYSALYFLPILSVIHCLFCGLICKFSIVYAFNMLLMIPCHYPLADNMFPYLSIIISMISNAFFLAIRLDQTMLSLLIVCTLDLKNAIIIRKYCPFPLHLHMRLTTLFSSSWALVGARLRNNCVTVSHLLALVRPPACTLLRHYREVHRPGRILGGKGAAQQLNIVHWMGFECLFISNRKCK